MDCLCVNYVACVLGRYPNLPNLQKFGQLFYFTGSEENKSRRYFSQKIGWYTLRKNFRTLGLRKITMFKDDQHRQIQNVEKLIIAGWERR